MSVKTARAITFAETPLAALFVSAEASGAWNMMEEAARNRPAPHTVEMGASVIKETVSANLGSTENFANWVSF